MVKANALLQPVRQDTWLFMIAQNLEPRSPSDQEAPMNALDRVIKFWRFSRVSKHRERLFFNVEIAARDTNMMKDHRFTGGAVAGNGAVIAPFTAARFAEELQPG